MPKVLCRLLGKGLTQQWTLWYNDLLGKTCSLVQGWHQCHGTNQPLCDWIHSLLYKMEPMAGTIHSTQKSQLARSWALGENVMLFNSAKWTECQAAFQILTVIARTSAAFNAHQRSLRLTEVNTETHSDCGKLSSKWDIYITSCSPQTSVWERGKHCRSQRSGRTTGNHFFQTWQGCCSHELRARLLLPWTQSSCGSLLA